MNKQLIRVLMGLGVVAVGIAALLGSFDIINFKDFFSNYWPLLVIAAGVLTFLSNPREFIWPLILIVAGIILEFRVLDIITVNPWQLVWPLIIVAIGLSIMFNRAHDRKNINKSELDSLSAIMSGNTTQNHSSDYKGGDITAVFGGVELDLRKAKITKEASINMFVLCGGVSLTVPEDWIVKSQVMPIAGGVENKAPTAGAKNSPTLIITGDVIMGGVEIKR
jgi:predicted membrane protein